MDQKDAETKRVGKEFEEILDREKPNDAPSVRNAEEDALESLDPRQLPAFEKP